MAYTTRNVDRDTVAVLPRPQAHAQARPGRSAPLGVDFETFASDLRRALSGVSPLDRVIADRLILAAWRLQLASAAEFESACLGDDLPPPSAESFEAERRLGHALELLEASRASRLGRDDRPAPELTPAVEDVPAFDDDDLGAADFSNEWPTLPDEPFELEEADDSTVAPRWQDRLVFDFDVSDASPVVKGTWVTVGHVVSLIVDGWSWSDVLRTHPELTEDDVRTCLAYTIDQDNSCGG